MPFAARSINVRRCACLLRFSRADAHSYSALRVDGKHLYEYARSKTPLPKPIETRKVTISEIKLVDWQEGGSHRYKWPTAALTPAELDEHHAIQKMVGTEPVESTETVSSADDGSQAPTFTISMTVTGGTYVRSIVHDLGIAVGSAAHVVSLERTRQGDVGIDDCVDWPTIRDALEAHENKREHKEGESGRKEWEEEILACFRPVDSLED